MRHEGPPRQYETNLRNTEIDHTSATTLEFNEELQNQPNKSIDEWYNQYRLEMYHYAFNLCKNSEQAEDVVQEAFFKLLQEQITVDFQVKNWLIVVIKNLIYDQTRTHKRRQLLLQSNGPTLESLQYVPRTPDAALELSCAKAELERKLAKLTDQQKKLFQLFEIDGLSYDKIANQLDIPIGTVMSKLSRIREKLHLPTTRHTKKNTA